MQAISGRKRKFEDMDSSTTEDADLELAPSKYFRSAPLDEDAGRKCPYLDEIDRKALDFDFEKVCSVTMMNHNVYGCLVCGSYFAGRAKKSPAYFHALQENHRIFIHLDNGKIYCLPDDYEIIDSSLDDIKHNLHPTFTEQEIWNLDHRVDYSHALNEHDYLPGIIGLNNLNNTDWLNVVLQSLMRVRPLRNYFIDSSNYIHGVRGRKPSILVTRFGELIRKFFNPRNFKDQVSPHELLQAVSLESAKKFQIGKKSDPLAFLAFFLNQLHRDLGGTKKHNSSIISQSFQGLITITTYTPKSKKAKIAALSSSAGDSKMEMDSDQALAPNGTDHQEDGTEELDEREYDISTENKTFFYLLLDVPRMPLFKETEEAKFIPQIPLPQLLNKFNGTQVEVLPDGTKKRYKFARLPPYLLVSYRRFSENNFLVEKNSTIVNFVLKGLDLKEYLHPPESDTVELRQWNIKKVCSLGEGLWCFDDYSFKLAMCLVVESVEKEIGEIGWKSAVCGFGEGERRIDSRDCEEISGSETVENKI